MCWSGEASFTIATVGAVAAGYAKYRGKSWDRIIPPLYFCIMEALQGFGYRYINRCEIEPNQLIALLSYIHICFQPIFTSMLILSFVEKGDKRNLYSKILYGSTFLGAFVMLLNMFEIQGLNHCVLGNPLCGNDVCTYSGDWHIAWRIPLNNLDTKYFLSYYIPSFIIPSLIGLYAFPVYHVFTGPVLSSFMSNNVNERPAIWCLLSEFILLTLYISPLEKMITKNSNKYKFKNHMIGIILLIFGLVLLSPNLLLKLV